MITIKKADLDDLSLRYLIKSHIAFCEACTPKGSCHYFDETALRDPKLSLLMALKDGHVVGMGGLYELDERHGEIKSMHTLQAVRKKGVAQLIYDRIEEMARKRRYERLSLETGGMKEFNPARDFYQRNGFKNCLPFGTYVHDPNSVFMTKELLSF